MFNKYSVVSHYILNKINPKTNQTVLYRWMKSKINLAIEFMAHVFLLTGPVARKHKSLDLTHLVPDDT